MPNRTARAMLAALGLALATPAVAQRALDVRIMPRAGELTPADWFYDEFSHFGVGDLEWTEAAILRAPIAGLTAELELVGTGVWVRGEVLRTIGGETRLIHAVLIESVGFDPPGVNRTYFTLPTAITLASLDLALPTTLRLPLGIQPYIAAGVAGKRYDFDTGPLGESVARRLVLPENGTELAWNVGAGAALEIRGIVLDVMVRDAISDYWGDQQHDVMVLGGIKLRLFRAGL